MTDNLSFFKTKLFSLSLPSHDEISKIAGETSSILENEITDYREESSDGIPGGLLDFSSDSLPLIVVPDIHARPDFIFNILNFKLPNKFLHKKERVIEALEKNHIYLVCVGDALHTERTRNRWKQAYEEFENSFYHGPAMSEEMLCGLNTILCLMELKKRFPRNFHFLKGNHENIYNRTGEGDYAFKKYADEGEMVKRFLFEVYGDDIIYLLSCIENDMPLMAVSKNCVISHAEPARAFSREKIVNARLYPQVVEGLTWTDNDEAEEGSVDQTIRSLFEGKKINIENFVYLAGHRTVPENYLLRQKRFIQFHNPAKQNVAIVSGDKVFNPEKDIVSVEKQRGIL